jgi:UDPglucose 6-dehydrogenase
VGLTTAVAFADMGITVYGIEVNEKRRSTIAAGKLPFHEPGLGEGLDRTLGKTFFVDVPVEEAVSKSDAVYYCVGTPYGKDGQADLSYLYGAIDQTLPAVSKDGFTVLVTKSTVPPSTTKDMVIPYIEKQGYTVGGNIGVANNPEFLREGHCWDDVVNADRIVLGVSDERSEKVLRKLYQGYTCPVHTVTLNTGEYIKYLSNTLLATLISWSNEMSLVADNIGDIQIAEAFRILHEDSRWGTPACNMATYAYPGAGYGGYCLPKDTNALFARSKALGYEPKMLGQTIAVNDAMPSAIAKIIERKVSSPEQVIGLCGLSFKPESDDTRDTPAAKIVAALNKDGYTNILGYDPLAIPEFKQYYAQLKMGFKESYDELVASSDVLVITTAWKEFSDLPEKAADKPIVDARYLL